MREGYASDAHQLARYAGQRRRAILAVIVLNLEARLTDAVLGMADKLIGSLFAKARNTARRRYAASAGDVGRIMRCSTAPSKPFSWPSRATPMRSRRWTMPWAGPSCCARDQVRELAELAGDDPLVHAADRRKTLRKFAPALIEALQFWAARAFADGLEAMMPRARYPRSHRQRPASG